MLFKFPTEKRQRQFRAGSWLQTNLSRVHLPPFYTQTPGGLRAPGSQSQKASFPVLPCEWQVRAHGRRKQMALCSFGKKVTTHRLLLGACPLWRQRAGRKLGSSFFCFCVIYLFCSIFMKDLMPMSLRNWVYIKNVKVPNLKASLRSPSKGSGRGEEKRSEAVMWGVREARRLPHLAFCSSGCVGSQRFPALVPILLPRVRRAGSSVPHIQRICEADRELGLVSAGKY